MHTTSFTPKPSFGRARFPVLQSVGLAATLFALTSGAWAQDTTNRDDRRRAVGERGNFNPQEMQSRMLGALRERLGITNDDEWAIISERVMKVAELRRMGGSGGPGAMAFGRGGAPGADASRGARGSRSGSGTEVAALQAAITDKLPDAEIKARLDRVREVRKENEAKLTQAQEELRAVLSVRQEAVLVMAGLLP